MLDSGSDRYTIPMMRRRSPLREAGAGGAGFPRICRADLGLWNCNEGRNLSLNGQFSPRPGAWHFLSTSHKPLKPADFKFLKPDRFLIPIAPALARVR
jgi:hypothetical protein